MKKLPLQNEPWLNIESLILIAFNESKMVFKGFWTSSFHMAWFLP